jgi:hypothetical protein
MGIGNRPDEVRTRRLIDRVMPLMLIFFGACAVYFSFVGDWSGAGWFAFCLGWGAFGMWLNRRWLSRIEPR